MKLNNPKSIMTNPEEMKINDSNYAIEMILISNVSLITDKFLKIINF